LFLTKRYFIFNSNRDLERCYANITRRRIDRFSYHSRLYDHNKGTEPDLSKEEFGGDFCLGGVIYLGVGDFFWGWGFVLGWGIFFGVGDFFWGRGFLASVPRGTGSQPPCSHQELKLWH